MVEKSKKKLTTLENRERKVLFALCYSKAVYFLQVLGACWYLLSIERQEDCWRRVCETERSSCNHRFFDCRRVFDPDRTVWFQSSNVTNLCSPSSKFYEFGIYGDSLISEVTKSPFFNKYFYCLWWGLKNLRCRRDLNSNRQLKMKNIYTLIFYFY